MNHLAQHPTTHTPRPNTVAIIIDPRTGNIIDEAFNRDTAISMITHDGMTAVAVADDGPDWPIARQQSIYDLERSLHLDCWN